METENKLRLADVFVAINDPRQPGKVEHDLVELLVVAVNAVLVGADTFVEIELWAKEKLDWLRGYLAGTHDEKMFRVVKDRAQWFDIVMGRPTGTDEHVTDAEETRIPLHSNIREALAMDLRSPETS